MVLHGEIIGGCSDLYYEVATTSVAAWSVECQINRDYFDTCKNGLGTQSEAE